MSTKKNLFEGYVPHGPEWKAYMMKQPKALCVEVATGIADERDKLRDELKRSIAILQLLADNPPTHHTDPSHMPTVMARAFIAERSK